MQSAATEERQSLINPPTNPAAYVAILAALVSAAIHLLLAPRVMGFNQTMGILFVLNALGFVGGIALYLTRYWRRELYPVAAGYAIVTIVAFFVLSGRLNAMSIAAKAAEAVFAATTIYLYRSEIGE